MQEFIAQYISTIEKVFPGTKPVKLIIGKKSKLIDEYIHFSKENNVDLRVLKFKIDLEQEYADMIEPSIYAIEYHIHNCNGYSTDHHPIIQIYDDDNGDNYLEFYLMAVGNLVPIEERIDIDTKLVSI